MFAGGQPFGNETTVSLDFTRITTRTLRKMGSFAGYCTISVFRISRNFAASAAIVNGFCNSAASVSRIP
jgi:hypothetical protein